MSDGEKVAAVCDGLADRFRTAANNGVTADDIPALVAAVEEARLEIAALVR